MATDQKGATGFDTVPIVLNRPMFKTLKLQPTKNNMNVQMSSIGGVNSSGIGAENLAVAAWTTENSPYYIIELLKFDLSTNLDVKAMIQ